LWGLLGSLPIVTAMLALSGVGLTVGANFTNIVQLELGDAVAVQVPPVIVKSVALAPLTVSLSGNENPDRLVTVTVLVFDAVVSVPYASAVGATVAGIVGPVLSATVYGLSGSGLSDTDSIADSVPNAPGLNVTIIEHAVFAASVVPQVPPVTEKSAALVPLKLSLNVTDCV